MAVSLRSSLGLFSVSSKRRHNLDVLRLERFWAAPVSATEPRSLAERLEPTDAGPALSFA